MSGGLVGLCRGLRERYKVDKGGGRTMLVNGGVWVVLGVRVGVGM